jgi:hypothetical protein
MNSQSIWQEQRQKMSPTAGTACDNRAPCPVIRASRTGSETFRGLTRVVHLLRAGLWLPDEAEVVHFPGAPVRRVSSSCPWPHDR